jgi:integrase
MVTKSTRRAKGSGSVRERSKAKWEVRYDGPPDAAGKRPKVYETVHGSRRDAERVLRERLGVVDSGSYVAKSSETVAEFMGKWMSTYAATNTNLRTQQGYRSQIRRNINTALGSIPVQNLRAPQIQALYASMRRRGLAPRSVLAVHRILKEALSHGVMWGDLARNPADTVTPPKVEKRTISPWEVETFYKFFDCAEDSQFRDVYHVAVLTGLRRAELCGLRWTEVDLDKGELRVFRTLQRITGMGLVEGEPKSERSRRTFALSQLAGDVLRQVRVKQMERQLALGESWQGDGHVFTGANGRPIDGDRLTRDFGRIVQRSGLKKLTLHGLRHTFVALLIAGGVHPRTIADMVGHSSSSFTLDVYGHLMRGVQEEAASAIDRQMARGSG